MRIPLIAAAVEGKLDAVEGLLTSRNTKVTVWCIDRVLERPYQVDEKDFDRRTALMHAAARGRRGIVEVGASLLSSH